MQLHPARPAHPADAVLGLGGDGGEALSEEHAVDVELRLEWDLGVVKEAAADGGFVVEVLLTHPIPGLTHRGGTGAVACRPRAGVA